MLKIDGRRYITVNEYAKMQGVSTARINQLKPTLPVRHFDEPNMDLLDLDQLELSDEARANAQVRFDTREPISTFTAAQLGDHFIALITRLTKQAISAEQLRDQAEVKYAEIHQALLDQTAAWQNQETILRETLNYVTGERDRTLTDNKQLNNDLEVASSKVTKLEQQNGILKAEKKGLVSSFCSFQHKIFTFRLVM